MQTCKPRKARRADLPDLLARSLEGPDVALRFRRLRLSWPEPSVVQHHRQCQGGVVRQSHGTGSWIDDLQSQSAFTDPIEMVEFDAIVVLYGYSQRAPHMSGNF